MANFHALIGKSRGFFNITHDGNDLTGGNFFEQMLNHKPTEWASSTCNRN